MYDRVITIYSGGKIFQATGARSGWVIGPEKYIKYVKSVYQITCFCQFSVVEGAVGKSLNDISQESNTYLLDYAKNMIEKRNLLLK
jgi:kynurenine aminotransferase